MDYIVIFMLGLLVFVPAAAAIIFFLLWKKDEKKPEAKSGADTTIVWLETRQREMAEAERRYQDAERRYQDAECRFKGAERNFADVEMRLPQAEQRYKELMAKIDAMSQVDAELDGKRKERELLIAEIASKYKERELLVAELADRRKELDVLAAELEGKRKEYELLLAELASKRKAYDALVADCDAKRKEFDALVAEVEGKRKERELLLAEVAHAKGTAVQANSDKSMLQDRVNALKDDVAQQNTAQNVLRTEKETLIREIDILKLSLASMKVKEEAPAPVVAPVAEEAKEPEPTVFRDVWEPILYPALPPLEMAAHHNRREEEEKFLVNTRNYILGKGLYFTDRVINAFHTSVKCNDISPMTLLSGVSGTGKSELPRCYAEGMGIHFTFLPVQPSWNSPKDLLGFYDYREGKYKATEFLRAMVRFEMYNRNKWIVENFRCDDRGDRMVMILLDGMNLARVEHYFSEFLSRLEIRRGISDMADPAQRAPADIVLEAPGDYPLRFFPGRNILFAGTINSDEGMFSVSDRVLDRSNLLNLGRPNNVNFKEKLVVQSTKPQYEGMTYKCWREWVTDYTDAPMTATISNWVNGLNDAMAEMKKPFGHRVAQAIATYVANYPRFVEDRINLALADQVEHRILPQLRGVDLWQHQASLEKIGKLIQKTKDEELYEAFAKGCQETLNGVFTWSGVDRTVKSEPVVEKK